MRPAQPLIVDDLASAIALLDDVSKEVVGPIAASLRHAAVLFASIHGWRIASHSAFVNWAAAEASEHVRWLVLDPLIDIARFGPDAFRIQCSRRFIRDSWEVISTPPEDLPLLVQHGSIGIVDDVCAFGSTLHHACTLVESAGGNVAQIVTCVASDQGRASLLTRDRTLEFKTLFDGDFEAIHLRDGCPGLPHAGRCIAQRTAILSPAGDISVRVPPTGFTGGVWEVLGRDRAFGFALQNARRDFVQRLSAALGHPATVQDMLVLGNSVPLLLFPHQPATYETPLHTLLN